MKLKLIVAAIAAAFFVTAPLSYGGTVDAAKVWKTHCAACHGHDGKGRTRAGRKARVKDFTNAKYQKTFTDQRAAERIEKGLKDKNGMTRMKAFGDKLSKDEIHALVKYVRHFAKGK